MKNTPEDDQHIYEMWIERVCGFCKKLESKYRVSDNQKEEIISLIRKAERILKICKLWNEQYKYEDESAIRLLEWRLNLSKINLLH